MEFLSNPIFVDQLCEAIALIVPIWFVLRYELIGILIGALIVWVVGVIAGEALSSLDPERDAGILDAIWLMFGWFGGLIYCGLIWAAKRIVILSCQLLWSSSNESEPEVDQESKTN